MSGPDAFVALVDYGAGNLASVRKALRAIGASVSSPRNASDLHEAGGIIVPGVGHFRATEALDERWREAVLAAVRRGAPLLGICLGMQWLFEASEEAPGARGLGVLPGVAVRLRGDGMPRVKVPHVGWNALDVSRASTVLASVRNGAHAYFTHSYAVPDSEATVASTHHGRPFPSVVEQGPVMGVQFHPEKSGDVGLTVLANFMRLVRLGAARRVRAHSR